MRGKMDPDYFQEKKEISLEALAFAVENVDKASAVIQAMKHNLPDLVSPTEVHDWLQSAAGQLISARRDFEKARWASVETDLEFNDWLRKAGHIDLVIE